MSAPEIDPKTRIFAYARAYRGPLGFPRKLGLITGVLLALLGFAFVARLGTDSYRALAGLGMVATVVASVGVSRFLKRRWRDPGSALYRALRRWNATEAARAQRAVHTWLRLGDAENKPGGESPELARLHLNRVLGAVPITEVIRSSQVVRRRLLLSVLPLVLGCLGILWQRPLMVIEGVDVLLAKGGVGPFPIAYVSDLSVTAELPSYLDGSGQRRIVGARLTAVPEGSEIEVRAIPQVQGRRLLLTDGIAEVPLVSDGQGGLVGRWVASERSMLRVAARFGDVLLYDGNEALLAPLPDHAPRVHLAGAPARRDLEGMQQLELDYSVVDDHGITQVDLVIESGQRVHREELAHLDGQKKVYRGAHRLTPDHEMLRRAFLPIRVRVEARDGNTATGPSWGSSAAIVLLPLPLGKKVAERHQRLREFRGALTAYLAEDIRASHLPPVEALEVREKALAKLRSDYDKLSEVLSQSVDVPRHSLAFLAAQLEALTRKGAERKSSEAVVLAADALIQNVSTKEAKTLSHDLGSAVEEIAVQSREIRHNAEEIRLQGLMDFVEGAMQGATQLREVGVLGLDLGSVARGDLARIQHSLGQRNFGRAEIAALHLAERLKRATPSFGSKGGGVEAGTPQSGGSGSGTSPSEGPPSDAPEQFQDLASKMDALAQETASELSELERMLREAQRAAEADFEARDEIKEATDALRRALQGLPESAPGSSGPRAEAAAARSHGEAMADALEAMDLREAIERGADAEEAVERARKMLEGTRGWVDPDALEQAHRALSDAMAEARRASEELNKKKSQEMGQALNERAARQREFSQRAEELAQRGREAEAPLPGESIEALGRAARLLKDAAREIESGRGEKGAEFAADAQAELERALPEPSEKSDSSHGSDGDSGPVSHQARVPGEEKDRARDFQERVERGLGRGAGRLSRAVRRYAEELK